MPNSAPTFSRSNSTSRHFDIGQMQIGRGHHELRAGIQRQLAGQDFFLARQQMSFQHGLDRAFVGGFHDVPHFAQDITRVTVLEPAEIDDQINLVRAVVHGNLRLVTLGVRVPRAQGKTDRARRPARRFPPARRGPVPPASRSRTRRKTNVPAPRRKVSRCRRASRPARTARVRCGRSAAVIAFFHRRQA